MVGCGLVFLLINLNLKTTLIILLVILVVSICVAIEIWLIFKIFELMTWVLRQTRQNVASNPNTPANILINLLLEFPRSVVENPAFALLQFTDLNLMASIPESDLIKILKGRRVPALLIEESIRRRSPKLTAALLKCPDLSAETIEQILDAIDEFPVADLLFKHRHCKHRIRLIIATSPDLQNLKYALIPHLRKRSPRSPQLLELIAATYQIAPIATLPPHDRTTHPPPKPQ
jgi:hypothetical protein